MAESTLSLTWTELKEEVARFLGFTRDSAKWTASERAEIEAVVQRGYRQFLFPPAIPTAAGEQPESHEWSFLRPVRVIDFWPDIAVDEAVTVEGGEFDPVADTTPVTASAASFYPSMIGAEIVITGIGSFEIVGYTSPTVITVSGDASAVSGVGFSISCGEGDYRLPDDFGDIEGKLYYTDKLARAPVQLVSEGEISARRSLGTVTGTPELAALRVVQPASDRGQRWYLAVWPKPNTHLQVRFQMIPLTDALSIEAPYPLGGMAHAETLLASCLDIAESAHDDEGGLQHARWLEKLQASITLDQRSGPENFGSNVDPSVYRREAGLRETVTWTVRYA